MKSETTSTTTSGIADAPRQAGWSGRDWLLVGLLLCAFAPLLLEFFENLWERPYYQFFPMALAGAVALGKRGLDELPRPLAPGAAWLTLPLLVMAFGLLAIGLRAWSPWVAALAALLGVAGLGWAAGGAPALRALVPALLLVCTFIPPPLQLDAHLMVALRGLAVQGSSRMLDFLGVVHALSGNVIDLPQRQLLVEEACSGINSVLLTLATCLFYLFWRRRSVWRILVCLPLVFAGVLLGNVIRICLGAWLQFFYHRDILTGWRHETVGLILLTGYVILILSLDEWFEFLTQPVRPVSPPEAGLVTPVVPAGKIAEPGTRRMAAAAVAPGWLLVVAAGFAVAGVVGFGVRLASPKRHFAIAGHSALAAGATFTLPAKMGDWQRMDSAAPFHLAQTQGINSQVWNFQIGSLVASVALDYPFRGFHDVTECYRFAGWNIDRVQRETLPGADGTDSGIPDLAVELSQDPMRTGSLWFSTVDEEGNWVERPTTSTDIMKLWQLNDQAQPNTYRVQMIITGFAPLQPAEREQARRLFVAAREQLVRQLLQKLRGKS